MFKGANKLNKVVEKRGRAADLQANKKAEMIRSVYSKMAQQGEDITSPSTPGGRALQNDLKSLKEKKGVGSTNEKLGIKRPIGKTVKRVEMGSKPINNSYKMGASDSAKKYTQAEINKFTKKKP
jgi:hypothetical protein